MKHSSVVSIAIETLSHKKLVPAQKTIILVVFVQVEGLADQRT